MITDALQQAIYTRLTAVSAVNDAVTGIYTSAPQSTTPEDASTFPYITIGPVTVSSRDDKDQNAIEALMDVHIWSRSQSALTWRGIASDVYDALQLHALSVPGANVIECRLDSSADFQDPDNFRTWHCVLTFRVLYFLT